MTALLSNRWPDPWYRSMPHIDETMIERVEAMLPYVLVLLAVSLSLDLYVLVRLARRPPDWRTDVAMIKSRPWSWYDAALLIVGLLATQAAIGFAVSICRRFSINCDQVAAEYPLIAGVLVLHLPALAIATLLLRMKRITLRDAFGCRRNNAMTDISKGVVLSIAVIAPVLLASAAGAGILQRYGLPIEEQEAVLAFRAASARPFWLQILMFLPAVTVVPLAEEVLFRGIALPILAKRLGVPLSVIFVSMLFAVVHFQVATYVPLFVLSVAFSLAYLLSGSMFVPVVMHGLFNMVMICLIMLQ